MAVSEIHPTPAAEQSTPYFCAVCGRRFATQRELRAHGRSAGLID